MTISKKLSIVLIFVILFSIMMPTIGYANDGGLPLFFNPNVDVTFTVDSDKAAPNKELNFTISFTNQSNSVLYISDISIYKNSSVIDEDHSFYFGDINAIVKPTETFTFQESIIPSVENFRFEDGKMYLRLNPIVSYQQYAPYSSNEHPVVGWTFESYAEKPLELTWSPPFVVDTPLEVCYTYNKQTVDDNILYDFTVKMKNTTDQDLYDLKIVSDTIIEGAITTKEDLSYIAPGEEKEISYTYDNSKSDKPYTAKKPFVVYVLSRYKDSEDYVASIAKNVGEMHFDLPSLKLRVKITCDLKNAHYNDHIPFELELFNPTKHTFKNIQFPGYNGEDIKEIKPNETITRDLIYSVGYGSNILSEGVNHTHYIEPEIYYQGYNLDYSQWCINNNKTSIPEIELTMPPQTNDLDITILSNNKINENEMSFVIENNSDENIALEFIGCLEDNYYYEYLYEIVAKSSKTTIELKPPIDVLVADQKNTYINFFLTGTGKKTGKLYWIHDYYKVDFIKPTPPPTTSTPTASPTPRPTSTPTPTPTPVPSPTSTPQNHKLIATIKNSNYTNMDNTQDVDLLLFNNSDETIYEIEVLDNDLNVIYTLKELPANEYKLVNLHIPSKENVSFNVTYSDAESKNLKVKTNRIMSLKLEKTKQINIFGNIFLLIVVLVLITFIIIIISQLKHRKNNKNF